MLISGQSKISHWNIYWPMTLGFTMLNNNLEISDTDLLKYELSVFPALVLVIQHIQPWADLQYIMSKARLTVELYSFYFAHQRRHQTAVWSCTKRDFTEVEAFERQMEDSNARTEIWEGSRATTLQPPPKVALRFMFWNESRTFEK